MFCNKSMYKDCIFCKMKNGDTMENFMMNKKNN